MVEAISYWSPIPTGTPYYLKRIQDDGIPAIAMNTSEFWSKLLVSDDDWNIMLKRIRDDGIPEMAMRTDRLCDDQGWILVETFGQR
jgi:hypothetical protein